MKTDCQSINEIQDAIIEEFCAFDDWMDRYQLLIDLGGELPALPDEYKVEENRIDGCQSSVWLICEEQNGTLTFRGESDALIVRGLVALLIRVFSGQTPEAILNADLYFVEQIGLREQLSPTRSNGLLAMIKQMRMYALAYKELQSSEDAGK